MSGARIYMVAAEASGDVLARETVEALKVVQPDLVFKGIGGEELAKVGIPSLFDISPLSILGIFDGLKVYGTVLKLVEAAVEDIIAFQPDAVVLVDSWGFMIRVAERLKARAPQIKIIKLVGPQIWATRPGRAKKLAAVIDHMICIHAMEAPYYAPFDVPVTVMGNPALSRTEPGDRARARRELQISDEAELVLVLPGSRPSEMRRVAPVLVEAARRLKLERPQTEIVFAPAGSVRSAFEESVPDLTDWAVLAPSSIASHDVMASADLALACSGTVTSELAVQGTPFIVGYKTGWITWAVARYWLYKPTHITLLNIAADDTEIAPEFMQTQFTPDTIMSKALELLSSPDRLAEQTAAQNKALTRMGEGLKRAPEIAAEAILSELPSSAGELA